MDQEVDLCATLAGAEAALARAVIDSVDESATWTSLNLRLNYLRVYCRRLRAALIELDANESSAGIDNVRAYCRELRVVILELRPSAKLPFYCDRPSCLVSRSPRTTCWLSLLEGMTVAPGGVETNTDGSTGMRNDLPATAIRPSGAGWLARKTLSTDVHAVSLLPRQAIGLLALVSAYLVYYFIDVHLQIVMLPVIFSLALL
ncbi:MAG: hypothetical protein D4R74_07710 [Betaproteobacteria bacterium]|nr:MAG: hypothetical protein D4R74_07710 [Betaproteobacteria bacterium]